MHEPVLLTEVITGLALHPGQTAVDLTAGSGGHAEKLLEAVGLEGRLVAIDRDPDAIKRCQERLRAPRDGVTVKRAAFSQVGAVLDDLGIARVDGVLLDLGVSREQLTTPERGFSFLRDGPLDMRMDPFQKISAVDLLSRLSESDLADVIWKFGEEHASRRIARRIVEERRAGPIRTTKQLAGIVSRACKRTGRTHPATKTFQALRIAVNDELGELERVLTLAVDRLACHGRLAVISYHSLEDRTVKNLFKTLRDQETIEWRHKKPIVPARSEVLRNPSARSAKLRIVERITI